MWDKPEEATLLMKKINDIESELNDYNSLLKELRELRFMVELSEEYGDEKEYIIELKKLKNLERRVVDYSYSQMLTGEYDTGDARLFKSTRVRAVLRRKIGRKCSIECIKDCRNERDSR